MKEMALFVVVVGVALIGKALGYSGDVYKTVRTDIGYWETDNAYCPTGWMPLPER